MEVVLSAPLIDATMLTGIILFKFRKRIAIEQQSVWPRLNYSCERLDVIKGLLEGISIHLHLHKSPRL